MSPRTALTAHEAPGRTLRGRTGAARHGRPRARRGALDDRRAARPRPLRARRPVTGGYLTYVTDDTPYTAGVEMTNLVDPAQVGGRHLVYLPRYCAPDDAAFDTADDVIADRCVEDLLRRYPHLTTDDVIATRVAKARHVMPVPVPGRGADAPAV